MRKVFKQWWEINRKRKIYRNIFPLRNLVQNASLRVRLAYYAIKSDHCWDLGSNQRGIGGGGAGVIGFLSGSNISRTWDQANFRTIKRGEKNVRGTYPNKPPIALLWSCMFCFPNECQKNLTIVFSYKIVCMLQFISGNFLFFFCFWVWWFMLMKLKQTKH